MKKRKKNEWFRKLMNDLHLWLGIISGLVLFIICITGSIYVFRPNIEKLLEPEKYYTNKITDKKYNLNELKHLVQTESGGKIIRVKIDDNPEKTYVFYVSYKGEKKSAVPYYVNPYTKEIQGFGKNKSADFFNTIKKLHRWLLLDNKIGRPITGISTIIFIFLSLSGLVLWLPRKIRGWKSLKQGLKIKFNANWKRVNHDLHNTLGFYTMLIALIMALTGLCWSFEWYRTGLSGVLGDKVFGVKTEIPPKSNWENATDTISFPEVLAISTSNLQYKGETTIYFPDNEKEAFEINKTFASRFNKSAYDRLFIDQYSGNILKTDIYDNKSFGGKIAYSIKEIHLGTIFGIYSQIIYFIISLILTSLPITGVLIWINKMKKTKK